MGTVGCISYGKNQRNHIPLEYELFEDNLQISCIGISLCMVPVIIPSFEPDERLIALLEQLTGMKISPIILINDGSGQQYDDIFFRARVIIEPYGGCILLHDQNCGKGHALKTGFSYVIKHLPYADGVVTADADGQHTPESIADVINAMAENRTALILGSRTFVGEKIPWKSRTGNKITKAFFSLLVGVAVTDTQTGLRGIPIQLLKEFTEIPGEHFEYEMQMLIEAAKKYKIIEVPIQTVYE